MESSTQVSLGNLDEETKNFRSVRHTNGFPIWQKGDFATEKFNIDAWIAESRKRATLEEIYKHLKELTYHLDNELVEVINKDYINFIGLSAHIVGINTEISELKPPLISMKQEVDVFVRSLEDTIRELESQIKEQQDLMEKRKILELFLGTSKSLERIEGMLRSQPGSTSPFGKFDEETGNLIERVVNEFNQLRFYVTFGNNSNYPFIKAIHLRMEQIELEVQSSLEQMFKESITVKNTNIVGHCLRTYVAINKPKKAEQIVRSVLVHTAVKKQFDALEETAEKAKAAQKTFVEPTWVATLYQGLLSFITNDFKWLLQLTTHKSMHNFDFLTNSVWAEICEQLTNKLSKVFHATFPAIFQKNFIVWMNFVREVENLCISSAHLDNLRAHSGTIEIFKKFSVSHSIYFQLRFQSIVQQLESGLMYSSWNTKRPLPVSIAQKTSISSVPKESIIPKEDQDIIDTRFKDYFFQWTQVTMFCLETCWKKDIFISPLTHRFFKLSVQIVHRLAKFVDEGLAGVLAQKQGVPLATLTPLEWGFVYEDLKSVQKQLTNELPTLIKARISEDLSVTNVSIVLDLINSSLTECNTRISQSLQPVFEYIVSTMIKKCSEALLPLRGIAATYRMTNKPIPTQPSFYVEQILIPLKDFLRETNTFLSLETIEKCKSEVVQAVISKFLEMATDLLDSVSKSAAKLLKFVKKVSQSDNNPSNISDTEKIHVQVQLDIDAFGKYCTEIGIDVGSLASFQTLKMLIKSKQQELSEAVHPEPK